MSIFDFIIVIRDEPARGGYEESGSKRKKVY